MAVVIGVISVIAVAIVAIFVVVVVSHGSVREAKLPGLSVGLPTFSRADGGASVCADAGGYVG